MRWLLPFYTTLWSIEVFATCNVGACIGVALGLGIITTATCVTAPTGAGLILCACSIATMATIVAADCAQCAFASACGEKDLAAIGHACGIPDPKDIILGPNQCAQTAHGAKVVDKIANKDVYTGGYVIHCENSAHVVGGIGDVCSFPCFQCPQCTGVPHKRLLIRDNMTFPLSDLEDVDGNQELSTSPKNSTESEHPLISSRDENYDHDLLSPEAASNDLVSRMVSNPASRLSEKRVVTVSDIEDRDVTDETFDSSTTNQVSQPSEPD